MKRQPKNTTSIIELLAEQYYRWAGPRPEYAFWAWLGAMGVDPVEADLVHLYEEMEDWDYDFEGNDQKGKIKASEA